MKVAEPCLATSGLVLQMLVVLRMLVDLWVTVVVQGFFYKCFSCTKTFAFAKAPLLTGSSFRCKLSFHHPRKFQVFLLSTGL